MVKQLACLTDLQSRRYVAFMHKLNELARCGSLQEYDTYSRIWEYPWVWFQLETLRGCGLRVLDIGSEISPFPWFLARQGFSVTVSDARANRWQDWQRASRQLKVAVRKRILDAQNLSVPTACVDVYLSVSVIEHVPDKAKAISEAARVLQPGGLLVMTFDICEPDMGMTFPAWNGLAPTMREFDDLFRGSPWFEPGLSELTWNVHDIPAYLSWNRTTAPHHNYVTGAAVVRRSERRWVESAWRNRSRTLKGELDTASSIANNYLRYSLRDVRSRFVRPARLLRKVLRRLTMSSRD